MVKDSADGGKISENGIGRRGIGNSLKLSLAACCLMLAAFISPALAQDRIGITPFKVFGSHELQYMQDAVPHMLFSRLPYRAKEVLGKDALRDALKGFENKDEMAQARRIIDAADYQYLITGAYTRMGDAFSLDVKVLKKGGTVFKALYVSMDKESKIFAAVEELSRQVAVFIEEGGRGQKGATKDSAVTAAAKDTAVAKDMKKVGNAFKRLNPVELSYSPTAGICLADIDGDGKKELITGGVSTIYVYRMGDARLNLLHSYNLKGYEILSINAGDFNKNGKDELYVTALYLDDAVTVIFEGAQGDNLQKQSEADWFVRVVNHPSEGELLLGQKMGKNDAFYGEIYQLGYNASGIFAKASFDLKKQLNLYQIQPIRYKGQNALAFFDDGDYLKIMDGKGNVLERLKERYGGSMQGISRGIYNREGEKFSPLYQRIIRVEGRDTDSLYVLKNEGSRFFARFKKFDGGQVAHLKFDQTNYKEADISEMIDGYLSDFAVDIKGGEIYVSVVTENKEGRIFIFHR